MKSWKNQNGFALCRRFLCFAHIILRYCGVFDRNALVFCWDPTYCGGQIGKATYFYLSSCVGICFDNQRLGDFILFFTFIFLCFSLTNIPQKKYLILDILGLYSIQMYHQINTHPKKEEVISNS